MADVGFKDLGKLTESAKPTSVGGATSSPGILDGIAKSGGIIDKVNSIVTNANQLINGVTHMLTNLGNLRENPQLASMLGQRAAQLQSGQPLNTVRNAPIPQQPQIYPEVTKESSPQGGVVPSSTPSVTPDKQYDQIMKALGAIKLGYGDIPISKVISEAKSNKKMIIKMLAAT